MQQRKNHIITQQK